MEKIFYCNNCGYKLSENAKFCSKCGTRIQSDVEEMKNGEAADIKKLTETPNVESSKTEEKPQGVQGTNEKKRKFGGKKFVAVLIIICLIVCVGVLKSKINDSKCIDIVKEGTFQAYPDILIGEAFEEFFANPKWDYVVIEKMDSSLKGSFVVFTGECYVNDVNTEIEANFYFNEDDSFDMSYLSYDGVSQSGLEIVSLLNGVFKSYMNKNGIQAQSNVSVESCQIVYDKYYGQCVDVTYTFTNVSGSANSFRYLYTSNVFQNGVGCDVKYLNSDSNKEVAAGFQHTFTERYILNNSYDDINISVQAFNALNPYDTTDLSVTYEMSSLLDAGGTEENTNNMDDELVSVDEVVGKYKAEFEDVEIEITADEWGGFYLTYKASGVTLKNISCSDASEDGNGISIFFNIDDVYPEHSGYVEFIYERDSVFTYSYNALIDSIEDTDGYYSSLISIE